MKVLVDAGDLWILRITAWGWLVNNPNTPNADNIRKAIENTDFQKESVNVSSGK